MAETITAQWSLLPKDLLLKINKCLNNTGVDTLRLRSVCSSWRSSIPPYKTTPPLPLNLPFAIAPNPALNRRRCGHFSLSESAIYFLQPTHEPPKSSTSKSKVSKVWLLRVEGTEPGKFQPLNPLSKILTEQLPICFPKTLNLLNFRITEIGKGYSLQFVELSKNIDRTFGELKSLLVKKAIVSSSPWTANADDYAVMAIHGGKLGFIKLGDKEWSLFDDPKQCDDVVYHKGKFYAVDCKGRTVAIGSDLKAKEMVPRMIGLGGGQYKYLVKSCDDLFLIDKYMSEEHQISYNEFVGDYEVEAVNPIPDVQVHFKVFKLNEEKKEWEWVNSLGDRVFFVGDDCSYSVSARDFVGLKGNCIYFSEDSFEGENEGLGELCPDTGVYCLEDGRCGALSAFRVHSKIFWPPPTWLSTNPSALKK